MWPFYDITVLLTGVTAETNVEIWYNKRKLVRVGLVDYKKHHGLLIGSGGVGNWL